MAQLLELALAEASEVLIPDPTALRSLARRLPDAPYGLLEVRLNTEDSQVDLSQGFRQVDKLALQNWLGAAPLNPKWEPLRSFVDSWSSDSGTLSEAVAEVGLEFDLLGNRDSIGALPSVFFRPFDEWSNSSDQHSLNTLIDAACDHLLPEKLAPNAAQAAKTLLTKLPRDTQLNHIAIMLGREVSTMRLQLKDIELTTAAPLLRRIGLEVPMGELLNQAKRHFTHGNVCLDVAPRLVPTVGVELFDRAAIHPQSTAKLLEELVTSELCDNDKRKAILAWPGTGTPQDYLSNWQEAHKPIDQNELMLITVPRRITHIKLSSDELGNVAAKAYLEFRQKITQLQRPIIRRQPE